MRERLMLSAQVIKKLFAGIAAGSMLLATAMPAAAEDMNSDKWEFGAEIYLWGAGIGTTTAEGDDIDISFSDLMKNLDMALMTTLVARKDKWTLFSDIIYLDVSASDKSTANIIGYPVKTKIDVGMEAWIVTTAGAYQVMQNENTRLDVLAGARYFWLKMPMKIKIGERSSIKASPSGDVWDGVVGIRGNTNLNDKWYLTYYLDVGTGDTDLTWQAVAGFNYRFDKLDAVFGYRYLDWDFDDDAAFQDINVSGPYAGVRFRF